MIFFINIVDRKIFFLIKWSDHWLIDILSRIQRIFHHSIPILNFSILPNCIQNFSSLRLFSEVDNFFDSMNFWLYKGLNILLISGDKNIFRYFLWSGFHRKIFVSQSYLLLLLLKHRHQSLYSLINLRLNNDSLSDWFNNLILHVDRITLNSFCNDFRLSIEGFNIDLRFLKDF